MFRIRDRFSGLQGKRSGLQFMQDAHCPISSSNGNCLFWSRPSLWTTITRALIKGGCCSWHVVIRFRPKCLTKWRRSSPTGQHLICFYWASQWFMFDKVSACTPSTLSPEGEKKQILPSSLPSSNSGRHFLWAMGSLVLWSIDWLVFFVTSCDCRRRGHSIIPPLWLKVCNHRL